MGTTQPSWLGQPFWLWAIRPMVWNSQCLIYILISTERLPNKAEGGIGNDSLFFIECMQRQGPNFTGSLYCALALSYSDGFLSPSLFWLSLQLLQQPGFILTSLYLVLSLLYLRVWLLLLEILGKSLGSRSPNRQDSTKGTSYPWACLWVSELNRWHAVWLT